MSTGHFVFEQELETGQWDSQIKKPPARRFFVPARIQSWSCGAAVGVGGCRVRASRIRSGSRNTKPCNGLTIALAP